MLLLNKPYIIFSFLSKAALKKLGCVFFLLMLVCSASAQKKYTISGTVKDAATGEVLIGATLTLKASSQSGTSSNSYGFYSITTAEGSYTLMVSYVGYAPASYAVELNANKTLDIALSPKAELAEVIINGRARNNENVAS